MDVSSSCKNKRGKADYLCLPVFVSIGSCGSLFGFLAYNSSIWSWGSGILSALQLTGIWRIVAALVVIAATFVYSKVLPLSWHIRFLHAFIYQVYLQPKPLPSDALFRPLITTTRNWPAECDYNIHKSNSTYFADMDIARAHLVSCLLKNWLNGNSRSASSCTKIPNNLKLDGSKRVSIALGGVSCHFRREIPPFAKYEIWTRVLCWDIKWIYIVCHFVKCGARPLGQRSSSKTLAINGSASAVTTSAGMQTDPPSSKIYATGITRYVFKQGRITVPPELFLSTCGLLPVRQVVSGMDATDLQWDRSEEEKKRGLKYMEAFATLDEIHEKFNDSTGNEALGHFGDS